MPNKKLKDYHAKRNFEHTSEPKGGAKGTGNTFVVQKHAASHLHYDFRLEVNGVLKSWAVPKGISKTINEKRLAVQTEDHPIEYAKFEGVIPKGHYGAGTVKIWDVGEYELISEGNHKTMTAGLKSGALKFILHGKKLKGTYALAHMNRADHPNLWLLFRIAKRNI